MSLLETLMLVGLGFAAAALIALLAARSAWNAAVRIAARRSQRRQPSALLELQADRDRLRAEYAMLSRKLEVRLGDLKNRLAEQQAEITRNRNRVETLVNEVAERDATVAARDAEIAGLKEAVAAQDAELATRASTLNALQEQLDVRAAEAAKAAQDIGGLNAEIAMRDQELASLRAQLEAEHSAAQAIEPGIMSAQERLKRRIEDLTAMSRDIATQRQQLSQEREQIVAMAEAAIDVAPSPAIAEQSRSLEDELAAAERESEELTNELKRLDQAWAQKLGDIGAAAPTTEPPEQASTGTIANVINLAARIRALKNDIVG